VQPRTGAVYFDGRSNRKRSVVLRFSSGLEIVERDTIVATWPYDAIRRADGRPDILRLSCVSALPLARLEVFDDVAKETILARCKSLDVGRSAPGQAWRIVGWSLAAVTSIVLLAYYGIPFAADRLAPLVPSTVEARIGEAVDRQARAIFGGKVCTDSDGQAAFASLVEKLRRAGGIEGPLDAHVLSSDIPNAFALPGGKVYVLDGLLQKARSADEVAGVLAHELGHVHHRDNMRKVIQAGGTSFLIGLLFGDLTGSSAIVFVGQTLFDASYSRDAERDADAFAIETMSKLGRPAKPLGEFLVRLTGSEAGKAMSLFASHPLSEDRLARMSSTGSASPGGELLFAAQWRALKNICRS
jgi:Zn-dependent protease with chaperone function